MDIEEAKAKLEEYISIYEQAKCQIQPSEVKAIETVLSELEKKDRIINLMVKQLAKLREKRRRRLFYKSTYKCMRNKI